MKKFLLPLLAINFISGCAYYEGLHNSTLGDSTKKHSKEATQVDVQSDQSPAPLEQNNPIDSASKMNAAAASKL